MNSENKTSSPTISFSWTILIILMVAGFLTTVARLIWGIGSISNLNDSYPWGLWISFDLLCGIALAAGAFTTAGGVYILGFDKFKPLLRPAILTGFLGYLLAILALGVDLGRPERIWHLIIYWNPHSVMFEVGWCVMLYTTILALEFLPMPLERFGLKKPLSIIHKFTIPIVIVGVVLSTLHQSSLGSLFLIVVNRLHPLWHSKLLPLFFFLTAVAVGPAVVVVEAYLSSRIFKRHFELDLLSRIVKVIPMLLGLYLVLRFGDLVIAGKLRTLFTGSLLTLLFWIEILIGVVAPIYLFSKASVRENQTSLVKTSLLVIIGVVLNRFNVSLIAIARPDGATYFPHLLEFCISFGVIAGGIFVFWLAARFLPIWEVSDDASKV